MQYLIENESIRLSLGEAARNRVVSLDIENYHSLLLELYHSVLKGKKSQENQLNLFELSGKILIKNICYES